MFMKKSILLLAIVALLLQGKVIASSVSQQQAQTIALNYFKLQVPSAASNSSLAMSLLFSKTESDGTTDFYVFNASPMNGFVIVSGDNSAIPVIGWSSESSFMLGDLNKTGISDWIKSSAIKIHYVVTNHIQADANIQNLWSSYAQSINPQTTRSGGVIGPLCTTIWNQSPYYNSLCPPGALPSSSLSKAVTGCVATAMAQIMKYWNYPAQGTGGVVSYNDFGWGQYPSYGNLSANMSRPLYWSNMGNNVTSDTDPVDSLMYELGVAVNMSYDSTGSGAFVLESEVGPGNPCSQTAFAQYFYYNPNTMQGVQMASYTTDAWIALMENEINSGRVVQYEGDDPNEGGHTWVMDGYQPNASGDYLHMNWGWGGAEDGFFSVSNLATPGFNPSQNDAALIGIEPLLPYHLTLSPSNPSICPNGTTNLAVQGPGSATYTWTPPTGLSCTSCTTPTANPTANTLYKVTVDSAGVIGTMSVLVTVTQPVVANFNFNAAASCSLPEAVAFINNSTNASSYVWNFGDGSPTSSAAAPSHSYTTSGNYTISLYATNSCGVDSLIQNQAVQISGGPPPASSVNICSGQTANVTATGSNLLWFSDAAAVDQIQTGNLYITPTLTATTTYYVGDVITPSAVIAGPVTDAIGATSEYTSTTPIRGIYFNSTKAQTLNSVDMYAVGAGGRTIILEDAAGNILDSLTVMLASGKQTVELGFPVPVGTNMLLAILGTTNLTKNTAGAVYPYASTDGTISITGNNENQTSSYYFFYNCQFQQNSCTTQLTPVTVFVLNTGGYYFYATGTGTPMVNFVPADTGSSNTYIWNFGDGSAVSNQPTPTHTYAAGGTYTVQLIISNGSCSDTVTRLINTSIVAGITDVQALSSLSVFPNPARDLVTLSVNSDKAFSGCELSINNLLGQSVYAKDVDLISGANKLDINISNLTAGIYFISLHNGKDIVTTKFVKE